ncbi:E3 ubiquitin-protein ligase TRIM56-like [Patiria miniata]|uniref:Uncharacterized protein n=1 Tax=Patiria miniata TaxID=46514 RepID=A0A914AM75_PATMI|nr:E3 ubiquitin-protein ligase TRIM56-like [Patiria miniata]
MATGSSVRSTLEQISGKHLECTICQEKHKLPKVLDCQHSFCEECLLTYHNGRYNAEPNIPCPLCRQETVLPVSGVKGLKTNFHLAGLIEEFKLQEKVACSAEAKLLCQVCDKGNEAKDRCLDWKVSMTKQPDEYTCHKHKQSLKQFYCKTCDELICQACTVIDHSKPNHDIIETGNASREYRESLKNDFSALGRIIQRLGLSLQDTIEAKKVVKDKTAKSRKEVQHRAVEVIAKVKAEEKRLLNEITTQEQEQNKRLDEHEKTLSTMLQRKEHSLQTSQAVTRNASDLDFLSLYPVIKKDMDKLRGQPTPKMVGLKSHPVFVQSKDEFQSARGIAAAAEPDEIAVTDWKNERVIICDEQADVTTVPDGWMVASLRVVQVYKRDRTLAYKFKTASESEVGETKIQSIVVMNNGNIIAGDTKRKVLTVHQPGKKGKLIRTIPLRIRPDFLAVLNNDWIAISDCEEGLAGIMDISHNKATTVAYVQPTIVGKPVKHCAGICSNSSGIYIAVDTGYVNTGHIHHYDSTCQFVSCVVQGLYNPLGITFKADGQQLAVADQYSVKIYHKV